MTNGKEIERQFLKTQSSLITKVPFQEGFLLNVQN